MSADLDAAGEALARARARRDSLSPEDAARAAGARTPQQITDLAARIRQDREAALQSTA